MVSDIGMEVIDGRDALALIVIREHDDGQATAEIRAMTIDKLSAAKILYNLAVHLKDAHESESDGSGS